MADGDYKFNITLDNTNFKLNIEQAKKAFASLVSEAKKAGAEIDNIPNPFDKIGSSAPQVAQATQQFNGLNMATQQLVRELPAASMGLNTFFLAISNNLPIFTDQVKNLRQQGTSVAGVLKGIGTALFSWQTALVLGVTALSMYGKEIGAWISSLFKGKEAVDALKDAQNGLNEEIAKNGLGIGKEIGKYESLRREFEAINGDLKEQERFVRDNQSAFDDLGVSVNSVIDAEDFFSGEGTEAFLKALRLRAEALAAEKLAVEQYEKAIRAETKASKLPEKIITSTTPIYARTRTGVVTTGYKVNTSDNPERKKLEAEAKAARDLTDVYFDLHDARMQEADDTLEAAGIEQSNKERERQRQAELRAAELRAEQIAKASARLKSDAQRKATQAEVDAMKEGIQKKIAQINLNYDLEEQAITKREEELKKLRGGMLTGSEQKAIDAMRKANASERDRSTQAAYDAVFAEADAWLEEHNSEVEEAGEALNEELARRTKAWEDYYLKYGTIKEQLLAVTKKYNRLISEAETEGERKALEAERDAALAAFEVQASVWAKDLANKSISELTKMMRELEEQVEAKQEAFDALESSDGAEAKDYLKTINELKAKIAELKKQLSGASKEAKDGNWEGAAQVVQGIASAAEDAAGALEGVDDELANTINSMAKFANVAASLVSAIAAVATASTALNMALGVIGLIATAIQVVSTAIGSIVQERNEVEKAMAEFSKRMKELNDELERMRRLGEINSLKGTIFGEDAFGNFKNNLAVMRDALSELEDVRDRITQRMNLNISYLKLDDEFANYEEVLRYLVGDRVPELFEGGLTLDKLKTWRDTDGWAAGISYEQRELIDELIADWERYEEAVTAVNDYLTDIFGDLGASITDSLVDAFRNGTDAVEAMGDAVGNVVEQIATDMAHAAFIQPLLEQAQEDIEALNKQRPEGGMSDEEYMRELMGITSTLMGNAQDAGEGMAAYLDTMRQMAKEMGIDVFESDSAKNSTHAKGFQTMSQETGSELNGRFTDIQGQTHRIADAVEFMKGLQMQHTQHMQSVSNTLASIHTNTTLIEQHTRELSSISADINVMRRAIDNGAI